MSDEAAGGKCLIGSNGKDLIINAGIQNGAKTWDFSGYRV